MAELERTLRKTFDPRGEILARMAAAEGRRDPRPDKIRSVTPM